MSRAQLSHLIRTLYVDTRCNLDGLSPHRTRCNRDVPFNRTSDNATLRRNVACEIPGTREGLGRGGWVGGWDRMCLLGREREG